LLGRGRCGKSTLDESGWAGKHKPTGAPDSAEWRTVRSLIREAGRRAVIVLIHQEAVAGSELSVPRTIFWGSCRGVTQRSNWGHSASRESGKILNRLNWYVSVLDDRRGFYSTAKKQWLRVPSRLISPKVLVFEGEADGVAKPTMRNLLLYNDD